LFPFGLGAAAFVGPNGSTALVKRHLFALLAGLPIAVATITLLLIGARNNVWGVGVAMVLWGVLNSAIPVAWSAWLSEGISAEPESGGGLMVAAIQLAIMLGAAFGGFLLAHISVAAVFVGGAVLLILASAAAAPALRPSHHEGCSGASRSLPSSTSLRTAALKRAFHRKGLDEDRLLISHRTFQM
jgi:predicted MFS family arabinose efflux permease